MEKRRFNVTKHFESQINDIMENFDFVQVGRAMAALQLKWSTYNESSGDFTKYDPSPREIKSVARDLLEGLCEDWQVESAINSTGGFRAERDRLNLRLAFEISEWEQ
jgi:hypothetical protein